MKNNKGFLGLGIILAIIVVLVIGGGAYYLGTKNVSVPKNTEENNQPIENQNSIVNNNIVADNKDNCKVGDTPWLKLLSPNGGETYVLGQTINIPIINGKLGLGLWQGIYLCEFRNNGGSRNIVATIIS